MDSGRLGHTCFSVLVAEGRGWRNKRFLSNKFNPGKWKDDDLFPFRLRDKIPLMIWICNVYKKTTAVSEGWKTKSVIPQKIVALIFDYSDEVGKRKEVINLRLSCPMCGMPKVNLILSLFCLFTSYHQKPLDMETTLGLWDVLSQKSCSHIKFLITGVIFPGLRFWEI